MSSTKKQQQPTAAKSAAFRGKQTKDAADGKKNVGTILVKANEARLNEADKHFSELLTTLDNAPPEMKTTSETFSNDGKASLIAVPKHSYDVVRFVGKDSLPDDVSDSELEKYTFHVLKNEEKPQPYSTFFEMPQWMVSISDDARKELSDKKRIHGNGWEACRHWCNQRETSQWFAVAEVHMQTTSQANGSESPVYSVYDKHKDKTTISGCVMFYLVEGESYTLLITSEDKPFSKKNLTVINVTTTIGRFNPELRLKQTSRILKRK